MLGGSIIRATLSLGRLAVLSIYLFAINRQLLLLNQWNRKNGHRNAFTTKSSPKNVRDVVIDFNVAHILGFATDPG